MANLRSRRGTIFSGLSVVVAAAVKRYFEGLASGGLNFEFLSIAHHAHELFNELLLQMFL